MSTTVDNRVVEMRFDNSNFESNVKESMSTLERLKQALKFNEGTKGLDQISAAAKNVKLDGIESGVESLRNKFSVLGVAGMSVINNLTNSAINLGKKLYNSTVGEVVHGGWNRAANIEQARFTLQGVLKDGALVKDVMKQAMDSVDGTAYGFDQAALAASQFASSGVKAGTQLEHALAGVAGTAATTGRDYAWISQIFTRVAGQGKVMATDLNSLASAGTNAAVEIANFMNGVNNGSIKVSDSIKKAVRDVSTSTKLTESDIRDFVSKSKINFDIFSEAMNNSFGEHAKDANKTFSGALDNVQARLKQIGQKFFVNYEDDGPLGILNENSPVVLFLNNLRKALTGLRDAIDPLAWAFREFVNTIADAGSAFLKFFITSDEVDGVTVKNADAMNMFSAAVRGVTNIFKFFVNILSSIGHAFAEAFPSVNILTIQGLASSFEAFTQRLLNNQSLIKGIGNTFKGLFAILRIIGTVLKNVFYIVSPLIELLPWVSAGIFGVTGSLSDQLVKLSESFAKWDGLKKVMEKVHEPLKKLGDAFEAFWKMLGPVKDFVRYMYLFYSVVGGGVDGVINALSHGFDKFANAIAAAWKALTGNDISSKISDWKNRFINLAETIVPIGGKIVDGVNKIRDSLLKFKNYLTSIDYSGATGTFRNFKEIFSLALTDIKTKIQEFLPSISTIKNAFDKFKNTLKSVYNFIKPLLDNISNAFSLFISKLDFGDLMAAGGLGAFVVFLKTIWKMVNGFYFMIKRLIGSADDFRKVTNVVTAFSDTLYSIRDKFKADAFRSIAISVAILAASMFLLASLDADKLLASGTAVASLLGMVIGSLKLFEKGKFAYTDIAISSLVGLSVAVLILSMALKKLAKLDPQGVLVGVLAMAGMLFMLAEFLHLVPERELAGMAGPIIGLSVALYIMASALKKLAKLNPQQLLTGLLGIVGLLGSLALFMNLVPEKKMAATASALVGLAVALRIMVMSVKALGKLDLATLGKGLGGLAAILLSLGLFIKFIPEKQLAGMAVGIGVISLAMLLFVQSVKKFGEMNIAELGKGLLGIAGVLAAIGLFTRIVKPQQIISIAAGVAIFGVAMLLFTSTIQKLAALKISELGKGLLGFAGALAAVALFTKVVKPEKMIANALGMVIMGAAMTMMTGVIERLGSMSWDNLVKGIIGFASALVIVGAATYMMTGAIAGAVSLVIVAAAMNLLVIPIEKLAKIKMGALVKALIGLAAGLAIIGVAGAALGIVSPLIFAFGVALTAVGAGIALVGVGFMAVATAISILATAMANGATTIMMGIMTIAVALPAVGTKMGEAILNMVTTILNGADQIIAGVTNVANQLLTALGTLIPKVSNLAAMLILSILTTINSYLPAIIQVAGDIIVNFLYGMAIQMPRIITAATYLMIMLVQGIAQNLPVIFNAGIEIVWNLVQGLFGGVAGLIGQVIELFSGLGTSILNAIKSVLGINSPSTEFYDIGSYSIEGLMQAINEQGGQPSSAMSQIGTDMLTSLQGSASSGDFQAVGSGWLSGLTAGLNSGETASSGEKAAGDAAQGAAGFTGEFNLAGNDLMSEMVSGLDSQAPNAATSAGNAAQQGAQAVRPYQSQWVSAGRYLMLGLVKGIQEKAPDAARAAGAAGKAAVTALQTAIQQGSPSKLTYQSGKFFDEGFINGMKALTYKIGSVAAAAGNKAVSELTSAVARISNLVDDISDSNWNPKITPVVDLANVSNSVRSIDTMLTSSEAIKLAGSANVQMTDNTTELQDYGVRVNNSDVVRAVSSLSEDIEDLKEAMRHLRVYMDTGALVGEIRDPIDKALGVKANRRARGG